MDPPGLSIFQGSDLQINRLQRIEEEELLEENKQREAELKDLFQVAFDDLNDDDDDETFASSLSSNLPHDRLDEFNGDKIDSYQKPVEKSKEKKVSFQTIDTSGKVFNKPLNDGKKDLTLQHYSHCYQNGISRPSDRDSFNAFKQTEPGSLEELKVLYDVRLREVERLQQDLITEREAKEEALHNLALSQAEKDNLVDEFEEAKRLLSGCQDRVAELEDTVTTLKTEILSLEQIKIERDNEIEIGRHQIASLQQRITALERCDLNTNRERQVDAFVESLKSKHSREISLLQQKVEALNLKLHEKEEENQQLEKKVVEADRRRAALMMEKCDSTNRQESALHALLEEAKAEKVDLTKKIMELQNEVEMLRGDLDQYESVNKLKLGWGSSSDEAEGMIRLTGAPPRSKPRNGVSSHTMDLNANLREELHRALLGQRAKRNEITRLQEQVRSKELLIQEMKEKERSYLNQAEGLREDIARVMKIHSEAKKPDCNHDDEIKTLHKELVALREVISDREATLDNLLKELDQANDRLKSEEVVRVEQGEQLLFSREQHVEKIRAEAERLLQTKESEWKAKFDYAMKESNEVKRMYMELRSSKQCIAKELEELKQHYSLILQQKEHADVMLSDCKSTIRQLAEENKILKSTKEASASGSTELSAKTQSEELKTLRGKLESAKSHLVELENNLKKEFETEVSSLKKENDSLKELIRVKEQKEMETGTSSSTVNETEYKTKLEKEVLAIEEKLLAQHRAELASAEDRIKTITVKYYSEQVKLLEDRYKNEIQQHNLKQQETIALLNDVLAEKDLQIEQLKILSDSSDQVVKIQKKYEEDRVKFLEVSKQWKKEVEALKNKLAEDSEKIDQLRSSLKIEKKMVQKYKTKYDCVKQKMEQEKIEHMLKIKSHVDNIMTTIDKADEKAAEKLLEVEKEFIAKERQLRDKVHKIKDSS